MHNRLHFLNTFTADGLGGNPTAVYFSYKRLENEAMQWLARELHLPVTAFVWEEENGCRIRYFTATCEIAACGHATLGAAAVSAEILNTSFVAFRTASDTSISTAANGGRVHMRYAPAVPSSARAEKPLLQALGLNSADQFEVYSAANTLVLLLHDAERLRRLQPAIRRLQQSTSRWDEVVVTAASDSSPYDYLLRSFCPWIGIDEDPVTGSVQAALAPFWSKRLGKKILTAYQASTRGGRMLLEVSNDRVSIGGECMFLSSFNR